MFCGTNINVVTKPLESEKRKTHLDEFKSAVLIETFINTKSRITEIFYTIFIHQWLNVLTLFMFCEEKKNRHEQNTQRQHYIVDENHLEI